VTTNSVGDLVYQVVGNRDIIRECASEEGVTNVMSLSLVYNRAADALQVVTGTNQTVVCTPLTFSGGTWLSNSNHTQADRVAFVYVETNDVTGGTLAATERFKYGPTNTLVFYRLVGQLQYTVPAVGTNPPVNYRGQLTAGTAHGGQGEGEDEDHGGHGDHEGQGGQGGQGDQNGQGGQGNQGGHEGGRGGD
jgi:hypothetical protein